ncbi:MAG: hypothetical protein EAZ24_08385 [Burkholderiales bacterium]|nr:MAG: hypothetical protein EAZ24_08385 [Burkholderiales bacterium]TAG78491.1 MAG: hypothetical protein EAZ21_12560 [Betaproteobacteria bacterium]
MKDASMLAARIPLNEHAVRLWRLTRAVNERLRCANWAVKPSSAERSQKRTAWNLAQNADAVNTSLKLCDST